MARWIRKGYKPQKDGEGGYWKDINAPVTFYAGSSCEERYEVPGRVWQWIPTEEDSGHTKR